MFDKRLSDGDSSMAMTVDAVCENGVLMLQQPLPLKEHEKVRVTVEPALSAADGRHDRLDGGH